jgi:hypothetical protein
MSRHPHLFDIGQLIQARLEFVLEARGLPRGTERNQKRQIARSLKKLIASQAAYNPRRPPQKHLRPRSSLNERLIHYAQGLRREAEEMPAGIQQEHLLRKAVEADEAIKINDRLSIPGRQRPG